MILKIFFNEIFNSCKVLNSNALPYTHSPSPVRFFDTHCTCYRYSIKFLKTHLVFSYWTSIGNSFQIIYIFLIFFPNNSNCSLCYGKVRNRNLFTFKIFAGFFNITTQVYSTVGGGVLKRAKALIRKVQLYLKIQW